MTNQPILRRRILPAILAALMLLPLLTACGGGGGEPAPAETQEPPARTESGPDLAQFAGLRKPEDLQASDEELEDVRMTVEMMEESWRHNAEADSAADARDWSRYSSPLGLNGLTEAEAAFYGRLEDLGRRYISNDNLDGIQSGSFSWYVSDRVPYGDLGLDRDRALSMVEWFLYNNPQYYFFTGGTLSNSHYTSLQIYDFVASGEERAEVTNQLFDRLDGWIQQVDDQAATTWQKELLANNLLCLENVYNYSEYDQSLYSAVMMGETVCAGFSKSFCAMMNALEVDTTAGLSHNEAENDGHAWNVVRFDDGNYYCVDVCWNNYDESQEGYLNNYLNVGEADSKDDDFARIYHTYQAGFEDLIPAIAEVSYVPTPYDTDTRKADEPLQPDESDLGAQPADPAQLVQPVKTGRTSPDVTVDEITASGFHCSGAPDYACLYLFPDGNFREEERTNRYSLGRTGYCYSYEVIRPNTTYYVGLRTEEPLDGTWRYSNWTYFTLTTPGLDFQLEAPRHLRVTAEVDSVTAAFDPVEGAQFYSVYRYEDKTHLLVSDIDISLDPTYTLTRGVKPGQTYYFGIAAMGGGDSRSDIAYFTVTTPEGRSDKFTEPVLSGPSAPEVSVEEVRPNGFTCSFQWKSGRTYYAALFTDSTYQEHGEPRRLTSGTWADSQVFQPGATYYLGIRFSEEADGGAQDSDWTCFSITTPEAA